LCASEENKGFYFGFFWSIYMTSQIIGNGIGGIIIVKTSGPWFFAIMGMIMIAAVIGFTFVIVPPHPEPELSSFKSDSKLVENLEK